MRYADPAVGKFTAHARSQQHGTNIPDEVRGISLTVIIMIWHITHRAPDSMWR